MDLLSHMSNVLIHERVSEKPSLQEQEQSESPTSPPGHTAGIGEVRQSVLKSSEHSEGPVYLTIYCISVHYIFCHMHINSICGLHV